MSKIKIEDLPSLEDLDPEDQCLIRGGEASRARRQRRSAIQRTRPIARSPAPDDDIIISRIPTES
jgi:hypothetical protein